MKQIATIMLLALALVLFGCSDDTLKPTAPLDAQTDLALAKAAPGSLNPHVIPPHARPHGKSYSEWSALWWRWLWSAPVDVNPGLDETGENISWGQSGNVWFLAPAYFGTDWVRSATMPSGTMLFVDLAAWFNAPQISDFATEEDLRAEIAELTDAITNIVFEVNGLGLEQIEMFRVQTPPGLFEYTLPDDNMFQLFGYDVPAGTYIGGVADGYYVMLKPLPVGEHEIFMSAEFGPDFVVQVIVNLTVAPRGQYLRRQN